jgi:hypothetical protein
MGTNLEFNDTNSPNNGSTKKIKMETKNDNDEYGLRYDEFTSINTRAIQELNIIIQEQNNIINDLKNQIEELRTTPPIPVLHRCVEVSLINNLLERITLLENNFSATNNING